MHNSQIQKGCSRENLSSLSGSPCPFLEATTTVRSLRTALEKIAYFRSRPVHFSPCPPSARPAHVLTIQCLRQPFPPESLLLVTPLSHTSPRVLLACQTQQSWKGFACDFSFTEKSSYLSSRFSESMLFPFCSMTLDFPFPFLCHYSRSSLDHWNSLPVSLLFFCSLSSNPPCSHHHRDCLKATLMTLI